MYTKLAKVTNPTGLHARPASEFVRAAGKFESLVSIRRAGSDSRANAKSIIMLLSLGLSQNTEVEISAEGRDEEQAVTTLVTLLESGFGEYS